MRRILEQDKETAIVRLARDRLRQGQRDETTLAAGTEAGASSAGDQPIQNEDGELLFMCGVSKCGGPDVCGP